MKDLKPNPKRIYASGFSGGARLATSLGSGSQLLQGVLSCGAALNLDSRGLPSIPSYSYAVIMGNEDMNYYELAFTKKYLDKIKMPHEIFVTEMKHRWPDEDQILLAFDWLELEAYKNRLIPVDSDVIQQVYTNYLKRAGFMKKTDRLLSANEEYLRILRNFRRYYNLDSVENLSNELRQSKSFRAQKKKNEILLKKEKELTNEFLNRFGADIEKNEYKMSWWENQIGRLKKKQDSGSWMQQKMYHRLLYRLYAMAIEAVNFETYISSFEQKKYCYDLCILIYPNYHVPYLKQIDLALGAGQTDLAIDYLEMLLSTGYETNKLNSAVPSLKNIEKNPRFRQLINTKKEL